MFRSAFTLIALVGYASAQLNQRGISSSCTSALTNTVANSDAAECLAASSLIPLFANTTSSIIPPIDNWLQKICSAPICSNDTLAGVVQNITEGCGSDLNIPVDSGSITTVTSIVQKFYLVARQIICLKDGSTNCITQALDNIQSIIGPITISNLLNLVGNIGTSGFPLNINIPSNITCTNCNKEIYNMLSQSNLFPINDLDPLIGPCGQSFTDGVDPSGVVETASNSTKTNTPSSAALGGVSLLSHGIFTGLSLSGLVVISTLFILLP